MPNVIFLTTDAASRLLTDSVFEKMSRAVAQAVSDKLELEGPQSVASYELAARRSFNTNPVQVLCVASRTESRVAKLVDLRDNILDALVSLKIDPECAAFFDVVGGSIESWPIMPDGSWSEVVLGEVSPD